MFQERAIARIVATTIASSEPSATEIESIVVSASPWCITSIWSLASAIWRRLRTSAGHALDRMDAAEESDGGVRCASMPGGSGGLLQLDGDRLVGAIDRCRQVKASNGIVSGDVGETAMESEPVARAEQIDRGGGEQRVGEPDRRRARPVIGQLDDTSGLGRARAVPSRSPRAASPTIWVVASPHSAASCTDPKGRAGSAATRARSNAVSDVGIVAS